MAIPNPNKRIRAEIRAEEEAVEGIDRLSTLPDHILTHILSFEDDPKSSIQTSVLAGRWRHLWKHVPRLFLNAKSFTVSTFSRYIHDVLFSRRDNCSVNDLWLFLSDFELDKPLFDKILKYVASHGLQHLLFVGTYNDVFEADSFGLISNNLISLLVRRADIGTGFGVCDFRMLTTLDLDECFLPCGSESELDPFANCPSLEKLVLCNSRLENDKCGFKITGPDLVTLLVYSLKCSKLELFAPKLKSFAYLDKWKSPKLFFLATPPIDHADFSMLHIPIRLVENNSEEMKEACFNMLQGLCNASSLELSSSVLKVTYL
ncbi:Putative FBD-associated F-box protein At5g22720 [Linum grandiflorum]